MPDITLGAVVDVPVGRGVVRFFGSTSFAPGKWVGIELNQADGKNDGTVQNVKYFTCKPSYGIFVKPSQVTVVSPEVVASTQPIPILAPAPVLARPGLGHQRTGSVSRAPSVRPSPATPGTSVSPRAMSPAKAFNTPNVSSHFISPSPSRPSRLGSPTKRPSISTPGQSKLAGPSRQPTLQPEAVSPTITRHRDLSTQELSPRIHASGSSPRMTALTPPGGLTASPGVPPPSSLQPIQTMYRRRTSSPPLVTSPQDIAAATAPTAPPPPPPVLEEPPRPSTPVRTVNDTELTDLRTKIRVLEARREADTQQMRKLQTCLSEAESQALANPRLVTKIKSLQAELTTMKRELSESQQLSELRAVEQQEQLEMAMLDKEMSEERAEIAEADLEEVKEKLAMVEVELQVLREGGGGDAGNETAVKQSLAYIQLEKQNERLKEALIRLRDVTSDNEHEQRRRIAEMEKDITSVDDLQGQFEAALIKLTNAEVQVDDLKAQLDDALGAEEILVQLTERNLMLGEKIEEMRITIEDLEALKELNDELEENHVETEKMMQDDLNTKDAEIFEQSRKVKQLEGSCQDYEGTIVQFRELVLQLQTDLDTLRTETQTAQHESATAASQTAAMMTLNLKLQSSASKNQARNIDLEVKRIEAREAKEFLSIVQPYLPQVYVETDMDATNCYLLFQRLALKLDLINNFVAQAHNLPECLNGPVTERLVGVCEMRSRLSNLSTTCKRFAAFLRRCDAESFLNIGRIYPEVAPMEKRIDMHIDLLRREEFRELECVSDAVKIQSQFDHIAETYFSGSDFDLGERELGYALSFDHDLEVFFASLGLIKSSVEAIINERQEDEGQRSRDNDDDDEDEEGEGETEEDGEEEGEDPDERFFKPVQKLLDQCRGARVLSKKLMKRVEDLTQDSAALKTRLLPQLQSLCNIVPELVNFGIQLAQQVMPHLSDVRSSKSSFSLGTVLKYVAQTAASTVGKSKEKINTSSSSNNNTSWQAVADFIADIVQEANKLVPLALEPENVVKITGTPAWSLRISDIKAATALNVEAERKASQLHEELQGLLRTLKSKDQHIQESSVKIELMERRMEAVKKQADHISELEVELAKAHKQERAYEEAMEQLQTDLDTLEQDNAKLKAAASAVEKQAGNTAIQPPEHENVPVEGSLETSYLLDQIDALRGTVRFLRTENSYLKSQDLLKEIESLPPLPKRPTTTTTTTATNFGFDLDRRRVPVVLPLVFNTASSSPSSPSASTSSSSEGESEDDDDDERWKGEMSKPTLRTLAAESKLLYRDVIKYTSSPRVVDLSVLKKKRIPAPVPVPDPTPVDVDVPADVDVPVDVDADADVPVPAPVDVGVDADVSDTAVTVESPVDADDPSSTITTTTDPALVALVPIQTMTTTEVTPTATTFVTGNEHLTTTTTTRRRAAWLPRRKTPAHQVWERKQEGERLGRRVQALLERTSSIVPLK